MAYIVQAVATGGPHTLTLTNSEGHITERNVSLEFDTYEEVEDTIDAGLIGGNGVWELLVFRTNTIIEDSLVFVGCHRIGKRHG